MIHTQLTFTEDSRSIEKLSSLREYWQILDSFPEDKMKVTPILMVSKQLEAQPKKLMKYLTTEEKASYDKKKSNKRKLEYLAGVISAKQLIRDITKDPKSIKNTEIKKTSKGQPYIYDSKKKEKSELNLSITHSGDYAIAVVGDSPIGVDIERIEERKESFYKEAFTEKERNQISSNSELGTVYWTIKEAVTKALGEGLNLSLHDIEISTDEKESSYKVDFSSKAAEAVPYTSDSFEIRSKKFKNYTLSYCEIKSEEHKKK